jgi:curved DNA-binding protein CbpA
MSLKNYYKILGVPLSATGDEVKGAFRVLAKKYHPDKAPDNPFAGAHFSDIQEAYTVLSNPSKRAAYDDERWLRGLAKRSDATVRVTPEWILLEAARLRRHMETVDTYRMNHAALRDYIVVLLSPEHLSVLQPAPEFHHRILDEIFASISELRYEYADPVAQQMRLLAGNNETHLQRITEWQSARRQEAKWNRYRPFIVISFALMICWLIWLLR